MKRDQTIRKPTDADKAKAVAWAKDRLSTRDARGQTLLQDVIKGEDVAEDTQRAIRVQSELALAYLAGKGGE